MSTKSGIWEREKFWGWKVRMMGWWMIRVIRSDLCLVPVQSFITPWLQRHVKLSKHTASVKCLYLDVHIGLVSSQYERHYNHVSVNAGRRCHWQRMNQTSYIRHGALHTAAQRCTAAHLSLCLHQSFSARCTLPYTLQKARHHHHHQWISGSRPSSPYFRPTYLF